MEKIKITAEDGEIIELFVIEQTRLEGINYLLVTETEDEEAEAYILKDISSDDDKEAVDEFVDDDNELDTLAKLFSELIEDTEIERLKTLKNYDDTQIKTDIADINSTLETKASTTDLENGLKTK